jgi:hypothetical protein
MCSTYFNKCANVRNPPQKSKSSASEYKEKNSFQDKNVYLQTHNRFTYQLLTKWATYQQKKQRLAV